LRTNFTQLVETSPRESPPIEFGIFCVLAKKLHRPHPGNIFEGAVRTLTLKGALAMFERNHAILSFTSEYFFARSEQQNAFGIVDVA
jgi:hypothetical protein